MTFNALGFPITLPPIPPNSIYNFVDEAEARRMYKGEGMTPMIYGRDNFPVDDGDDVYVLKQTRSGHLLGWKKTQVDYFHGMFGKLPICQDMDEDDYFCIEMLRVGGYAEKAVIILQQLFRERRSKHMGHLRHMIGLKIARAALQKNKDNADNALPPMWECIYPSMPNSSKEREVPCQARDLIV